MKEIVYVTYTCKRCGKAFVDVDTNNSINEIPLKTRYCPECVLIGFKNDNKTKFNSKEQERAKFLEEKIRENNITDKKDISFIKRKFFKDLKFKESTNQRIYLNNIFKDTLEILSYQDWKK